MNEKSYIWFIEPVSTPDVYILKAGWPEKEEVWGWLKGHQGEKPILFSPALYFLGSGADVQQCSYFNGLAYLFFSKSISQVLVGLLVQAFIATNGSDQKHGTHGVKKTFRYWVSGQAVRSGRL